MSSIDATIPLVIRTAKDRGASRRVAYDGAPLHNRRQGGRGSRQAFLKYDAREAKHIAYCSTSREVESGHSPALAPFVRTVVIPVKLDLRRLKARRQNLGADCRNLRDAQSFLPIIEAGLSQYTTFPRLEHPLSGSAPSKRRGRRAISKQAATAGSHPGSACEDLDNCRYGSRFVVARRKISSRPATAGEIAGSDREGMLVELGQRDRHPPVTSRDGLCHLGLYDTDPAARGSPARRLRGAWPSDARGRPASSPRPPERQAAGATAETELQHQAPSASATGPHGSRPWSGKSACEREPPAADESEDGPKRNGPASNEAGPLKYQEGASVSRAGPRAGNSPPCRRNDRSCRSPAPRRSRRRRPCPASRPRDGRRSAVSSSRPRAPAGR